MVRRRSRSHGEPFRVSRGFVASVTGKGGQLRRVRGGRVAGAGSFPPALRLFIERRAAAWGVSFSAVVVSMCAWAAGIDVEDV